MTSLDLERLQAVTGLQCSRPLLSNMVIGKPNICFIFTFQVPSRMVEIFLQLHFLFQEILARILHMSEGNPNEPGNFNNKHLVIGNLFL